MTQLISKTIIKVTKLVRSYHQYKPKTGLTCQNNGFHLNNKCLQELKTPELVYIPQVLRWLKTKIGFKLLQKGWDPDFSEGAFIYGSTQAICRVTEIIGKSDEDNELNKLVTKKLHRKLELDMKHRLTDLQKKIIHLKPEDVKLLIPLQVQLKIENERKIAHVLLRALAVKWQNINEAMRLAIIALQTEFIRDYTDADFSEWTLNTFDILECGVVGKPIVKKYGAFN